MRTVLPIVHGFSAVNAFTGILCEGLGLQSTEASAMRALGVGNVPNGANDQCDQKSDAPGGIGRQQNNADQAADAADEHAYLLYQNGNLTDHALLLFR